MQQHPRTIAAPSIYTCMDLLRTGGALGDLGAADAHGDADVGVLERGGVVHAVACHGHHLHAMEGDGFVWRMLVMG